MIREKVGIFLRKMGNAGKRHKFLFPLLIIILTMIVGAVDYITGPKIGFSLFYFLPISLAAWNLGLSQGVAIAVLSAVIWLIDEVLTGGPIATYLVPMWNSAIRMSIFLIFTYTLYLIKMGQNKEKELRDFIVHDLNTPIAVVRDSLVLLEKSCKDLDEAQQKLLVRSISSVKRLASLTQSILDVSRLEAGKMVLNMEVVSVRHMVDLAIEEASVWAESKNITIVPQFNLLRETICVDKGLLVRMLVNLLSNAIKASPPESAVRIYLFSYDEANIAFSISDQGAGIPGGLTERIFDKFEQAKAAGSGIAAGSGLGLSFCKMAVTELGGDIWIESEEGKGTIVTFKIPVKL